MKKCLMFFLALLSLLPEGVAQVQYQLNGPVTVCKGNDSVFYIMDSYPGATAYSWQLPSGMTGQSNSDSIWVQVSQSAISGQISVQAYLPEDTLEWSLFVQVYDIKPAKVDTIIGPNSLSSIDSYAHYYASSLSPAQNYEWIYPDGFTCENYGANVTLYITEQSTSGKIGVVPINPCGRGDTTYLNITITPIRNDTVLGDTIVCMRSNNSYWIITENETATYYWELPEGISIFGDSLSSGISVQVSDTAVSGWIRVYEQIGDDSVFVAETHIRILNKFLEQPTEIYGPESVTIGDHQVNYWIDPVPDATSYQWILPSGIYGTSSINRIQVDIETWAQSDYIYVRAMNCFPGMWKDLYIMVRNPSLFSDTIYGSDFLCAGTDSVKYKVPEMEGMSGYQWTLSPNLTGTSTTNSIWVSVADTATYVTLSVVGYNETDTSKIIVRTIRVNTKPKLLGIQGPITVSASEIPVRYYVTKQEDVFHYYWVLPEGFTGMSWMDTIQVLVTDSATSGWIKVIYLGPCCEGMMDSLYVTVDSTLVGLEVVKTDLHTYPNPFRETLNLRSSLLLDGQAVVTVLDLNGVRLPIEAVGKGEERTLNFSLQPAGYYLIVVQTPTKKERIKVLKQ